MGGGQILSVIPADWGYSVAEARSNMPKIEVMERELKKQKVDDYNPANIDRRLHDFIMGLDKPNKSDRVRIAVIVNGDENMVVEDRVKNQVYSHLREKFPVDYFAIFKGTDINSKLLQYAEDLYYDQREIATTRETEYEYTKKTRGIRGSVGGVKNIFDTSPKNSSAITMSSAGTGSITGSQSNSGEDDDDEENQGVSAKDSFNNTVNASTTGIINNFTNSDHKGWGGKITIGNRTKDVSGSETQVTKPSRVDVDGLAVGNRPRGLSDMRRIDYVRAGRECNYDYVFVMTLSNGKGKIYNHDLLITSSNTVTKNVWLRLRLVDVKSGNYLYRNDIPAYGKTHNGHINGRVLERSVAKAMQEAMDDIKIGER